MKSFKKWAVILLVFWGIWKIFFFLLKDVLFAVLTFPDPYANILQMVGMGMILLLSLIFTALLVKDSAR
ncbi:MULTISPECIES: hypothetical protein [Paenibacillus]|jgi:hypothetical protein|uniref:Uncharacterized protein n=2 Tax=Paenibacillus barengoltzii TaxID=343517 RepID=R9LAN9_9BACL|nr:MULTISPECIES: hypothetical protein [Paenibacillus]EOS55829.1 hypothetical protein C812_02409 [Paenibacillus barengoltzii G22]MEC2342807.1 hypothetical protein [Paenibacillus barengoltzii]